MDCAEKLHQQQSALPVTDSLKAMKVGSEKNINQRPVRWLVDNDSDQMKHIGFPAVVHGGRSERSERAGKLEPKGRAVVNLSV